MDRDVPSVPITTLAGVASLTDLLPEMPLPTPLPQTLSNKSLLFHPRVAEEAQNYLRTQDDMLVPQLLQSLSQTSADHIDVKDNFMCSETSVDPHGDIPPLLQSLIAANPNVFRGKGDHNNMLLLDKNLDPYTHGNTVLNSCKPLQDGNLHPYHDASLQALPNAHLPMENSMGMHAMGARMDLPNNTGVPHVPIQQQQQQQPDQMMYSDPMQQQQQQMHHQHNQHLQLPHQQQHLPQQQQHQMDYENYHQQTQDSHLGHHQQLPQQHLDHVNQSMVPQQNVQHHQPEMFHQDLSGMVPHSINQNHLDKSAANSSDPVIMQPVVRLQRISDQDQMLMQKSLTNFIENRPKLAKELGIDDIVEGNPEQTNSNAKTARSRGAAKYKDNSGSEDEDGEMNDEKDESGKKKKASKKNSVEEEDFVPDTFTALVGKKRRFEPTVERTAEPVIKPKLRKVEKKLGPIVHKMTIEELMESSTYGRFNKNVEYVMKFYSNIDVTEIGDDGMVPDEHLLSRHIVQELATEAAKLNINAGMEMIPTDKIVKLLNALEITIRGADRVTPITDEDNENMRQLWIETAMERVMGAADACLTCLHILTARNMPKRVYIEDVIDRIVLFIKYQLVNTIFPSYDVTYRVDSKKKADGRKKKSVQSLDRNIQILYNKLCELVSKLADLMEIQLLTDTIVLHTSSMGVSPFFTENVSELQLSSLKLVTTLFTRYEKHRRLLLDDILASIARLPSSKRSLRTYKLNSEENIQMLTALVLQLIQCIVVLPENLNKRKNKDREKEEKKNREREGEDRDKLKNVDKDVLISNKNREAISTAGTFLSAFLSKCGTKNEDIDYRPLFENFVQDLLTTVNKPEWPATEMVLSLLGKLLVSNFSNKGIDMSLRVASLDYLGVVAARLRRDSVLSRCKLSTIDHMIKEIKAEELRETEGEVVSRELEIKNDEERIQFLQRVLLDFLAVNAQNDEAYKFARHFYIVQWYKECHSEKQAIKEPKNNAKDNHRNRKRIVDSDNSDEELSNPREKEKDIESLIEQQKLLDERKKFLLSKVCSFKEAVSAGNKIKVFETYIDYEMAELIAQYLASKRHFSKCFDIYLKSILFVLREPSIAIRTKAMKCLTMIVEADPSVLGTRDVQIGVNYSIVDHSTSVREAAVDLVGKFVLSRPELINKYYQVLLDRILDTGVSVRKRVIKILKDICIECPEFPKIPEICVKMIRRVNDEEGIRKLVMEVFQNMWFTSSSANSLLRKVMNITDVVASSNDSLEWFEQLLVSLFKPKEDKDDSTKVNTEPPKALLIACKQIVDCLIENILTIEESTGNGTSQRLIACITTLYLFAKIRPQLLVKHASTLQPYLSVKCDSRDESAIIERVAKMLELVVPMMEHPSDSFLSQLEEDLMKLILQHDRNIVSSCVSCLAAIVNRVTRNFKLIRDCFTKYFQFLERFYDGLRNQHPQYQLNDVRIRGYFRRSLFTVGLLFRYFDFKNPEVSDTLMNTKDKIYEMFMYFLHRDDEDIQANTLKAMGAICIRHYEFMLEEELKMYYHRMLESTEVPLRNRIEVLRNIESYLVEEEHRMIQQDLEWSKRSKMENLKEMGDVSSGMASTIIQLYLKEVLKAYQHADATVRQPALKVIQLVLQQGLVHPVQIIPYLICMSTDPAACISSVADKQLAEIDKKYPGFIYAPSVFGIRLSYELQCMINPSTTLVIRGWKIKNQGEYPSALNGYLYTMLRGSKQQRRALVLSILRQFDQSCTSLSYMLYLADNLAYFPYQVQDELLFIVHQINVILAASGANLLQTFRESLIMTEAQKIALETAQQRGEPMVTALDDEDEDEESLVERVPEDVSVLQDCLKSAQGSLLLLVLKQHLKDTFGLSDGKIQQYSPSEPVKVHEKVANRKSNALFNPKTTLNKINQGPPPQYLDFEGRKDLIRQYLDFKQLMMQLDPEDDEDDPNAKTPAVNANVTFNNVATSSILTDADQVVLSNYKDNAPPKVPKLVISNRRLDSEPKQRTPRKSTTEKLRKHRHKKKRRKIVSSGDESDFSDPDYMG